MKCSQNIKKVISEPLRNIWSKYSDERDDNNFAYAFLYLLLFIADVGAL